ncbi:hypothetical protein E8E13_011457 [Curvularia kusanoi]|uniref:Uncharacterized protein n=1 Tax=Curvularia kusanoi TaxID=90978 RepID=A0A9P4TP16_CURKU|nr:hypothetical protein E8E13_011457 [Curvularia kusanoi]
MPKSWFASKTDPNGEATHYEDGCHPSEAAALKTYLKQHTSPQEAAHAITHFTSSSLTPREELPRLWSLLQDALVELPETTLDRLIALMSAIEDLPNPPSVPLANNNPATRFWKDSPAFGHLWSDMSPSYEWRRTLEASSGSRRTAVCESLVRRAEVEARLVSAGLAGLEIHGGFEVVADALESSGSIREVEVSSVARWMEWCGGQMKMAAQRGEGSWALERSETGARRDLWRKPGDGVGEMTLDRWRFWEGRLREMQDDPVVARDAKRALEAMGKF